jgi:hypothetical protein
MPRNASMSNGEFADFFSKAAKASILALFWFFGELGGATDVFRRAKDRLVSVRLGIHTHRVCT